MRSFEESAERWKRKREQATRQVIDTSLDMRRDLQRGNPVLSGRSSASWNIKSGTMSTSRQPPEYWNPGEGRFLDAETDVGSFRLGQIIHTSNLQNYIQKLEYQHATAAGWVRRTVDVYKQIISRNLSRSLR